MLHDEGASSGSGLSLITVVSGPSSAFITALELSALTVYALLGST